LFCYTIVKKERRFFLLKDEHSAADEKIDDGESSEISVLLYASKRKNKSVRDSFPQSIYPLSYSFSIDIFFPFTFSHFTFHTSPLYVALSSSTFYQQLSTYSLLLSIQSYYKHEHRSVLIKM
jgi:hypothetical protein